MVKRTKKSDDVKNAFLGGRRTYIDTSTGETYTSWGPDNSERARNLRKRIFK